MQHNPMSRPSTRSGFSARPADSISEELAPSRSATPAPAIQNVFQEETSALDGNQEQAIRKLKLDNDILQAQLDKIKGDNLFRKIHSTLIFFMVFIWLAAVLAILAFVGKGVFTLSDKVLITLLTTTSINVIGLLVIVANYLFNKNKST